VNNLLKRFLLPAGDGRIKSQAVAVKLLIAQGFNPTPVTKSA
jgi:hypothetical protein